MCCKFQTSALISPRGPGGPIRSPTSLMEHMHAKRIVLWGASMHTIRHCMGSKAHTQTAVPHKCNGHNVTEDDNWKSGRMDQGCDPLLSCFFAFCSTPGPEVFPARPGKTESDERLWPSRTVLASGMHVRSRGSFTSEDVRPSDLFQEMLGHPGPPFAGELASSSAAHLGKAARVPRLPSAFRQASRHSYPASWALQEASQNLVCCC
jgi:hypothetical protein